MLGIYHCLSPMIAAASYPQKPLWGRVAQSSLRFSAASSLGSSRSAPFTKTLQIRSYLLVGAHMLFLHVKLLKKQIDLLFFFGIDEMLFTASLMSRPWDGRRWEPRSSSSWWRKLCEQTKCRICLLFFHSLLSIAIAVIKYLTLTSELLNAHYVCQMTRIYPS